MTVTPWGNHRPPVYALIDGRSGTAHLDLDMATLVRAGRSADSGALEPEHARILRLCPKWRSVAEIAALSDRPLTVTKVHLSDLAGCGAITISAPSRHTIAAVPDRDVLLRLRDGLRNLA